jgi:hypothetical protein
MWYTRFTGLVVSVTLRAYELLHFLLYFRRMRDFDTRTFCIVTMISFVLIFPCGLAAWAEDERTPGENILLIALSKLFYFLCFPSSVIPFFSSGSVMLFIGLTLNCLFWGIVFERLFYVKSGFTRS